MINPLRDPGFLERVSRAQTVIDNAVDDVERARSEFAGAVDALSIERVPRLGSWQVRMRFGADQVERLTMAQELSSNAVRDVAEASSILAPVLEQLPTVRFDLDRVRAAAQDVSARSQSLASGISPQLDGDSAVIKELDPTVLGDDFAAAFDQVNSHYTAFQIAAKGRRGETTTVPWEPLPWIDIDERAAASSEYAEAVFDGLRRAQDVHAARAATRTEAIPTTWSTGALEQATESIARHHDATRSHLAGALGQMVSEPVDRSMWKAAAGSGYDVRRNSTFALRAPHAMHSSIGQARAHLAAGLDDIEHARSLTSASDLSDAERHAVGVTLDAARADFQRLDTAAREIGELVRDEHVNGSPMMSGTRSFFDMVTPSGGAAVETKHFNASRAIELNERKQHPGVGMRIVLKPSTLDTAALRELGRDPYVSEYERARFTGMALTRREPQLALASPPSEAVRAAVSYVDDADLDTAIELLRERRAARN